LTIRWLNIILKLFDIETKARGMIHNLIMLVSSFFLEKGRELPAEGSKSQTRELIVI